ncbi:hypothetical protein OG349_05935 [Streptomyces sp. NBC_01317]|uniref:hypothetical protein n=1 Tax=Streptomyces sp. NBC_01317 TaxID=2903822 RepID=UPI002E104CB2|nr:hypothetical protein OG349_05935 [Streptomyces sp. NBC_01317]
MPIDPFAALNALLRAEAARADEPEIRRRPPTGETDPAAAGDHAAVDGQRNESGTPR